MVSNPADEAADLQNDSVDHDSEELAQEAQSIINTLKNEEYNVVSALDSQERAQRIRDLKLDIKLKKKYAKEFILISKLILFGTFAVSVLVGFGKMEFGGNELSVLIYSTFIEVFGIVFVITRYLFYRPGGSNASGSEQGRFGDRLQKYMKLGE